MLIKEIIYSIVACKPSFIKNLRVSKNTHVYVSKSANVQVSNYSRINIPERHDIKTNRGQFLVEKNATVNIGSITTMDGSCIFAWNNSNLTIGDRVFFNKNTYLWCTNSITIGSDTIIAPDVIIRDSDGHFIEGKNKIAPITIGNHVWIGAKTIILKGVTIGDNTVIGAGSVVAHDIPSNCLAVGNPAKIIRENIEWHY